MQPAACFVCDRSEFAPSPGGSAINGWRLFRCLSCGMVTAAGPGDSRADYSDYGDYLISVDRASIEHRIGCSSYRRRLDYVRNRFGPGSAILDFGCGGGYFIRAAQKAGFDAYGVEVSDKLRKFSREEVGAKNIFPDIGGIETVFDVIYMFDVIEHFSPALSRGIMRGIVSRLKPGGILAGNTPNYNSANILLCGSRDPVIAPPLHMCYFTVASLQAYLGSLGLIREKIFTRGLSSNSFFRPAKNERSFLEIRRAELPCRMVLLRGGIKNIFRIAGRALGPLGLGYQLFFRYRKENSGDTRLTE